MKATGIILSDSGIKGDYEDYIKACEDYSLLNGSKVDHSDLKDMANEIISTANYNIDIKKKESEKLSILIEDSVKIMEDKFLHVLNDYNENNIDFKNALSKVINVENSNMYNVKDESVRVDTCVSEALSVILNDPQIKADYEEYKQNCTKYSVMTYKDEHKIDSELLDMKNQILNLINCNNLSSEKFHSKNEVEDKVINGAKKIKNDYSLSSQVDVNYSVSIKKTKNH